VSESKPFEIPKEVVKEAYRKVKANKGAPGVDGESIKEFERSLEGNLYKLWNRMSSGSYFPPPVRAVEIPKPGGRGVRVLGVPTVADRIAQTVVKLYLEPVVEPIFHENSYGYRPGRSALDAVGACRERCWRMDWVIDLDIKAFLETSSHYPPSSSSRLMRLRRGPSGASGSSMRRPLRRPERRCMARSSPRFTRCNTVCRETSSAFMASHMVTQP